MIFKPQSNRSSLYVNNVTLRSNHSLNRSLNRNLNRSSLYINNGDVTQTAAVGTAAVCLGHQYCSGRLCLLPSVLWVDTFYIGMSSPKEKSFQRNLSLEFWIMNFRLGFLDLRLGVSFETEFQAQCTAQYSIVVALRTRCLNQAYDWTATKKSQIENSSQLNFQW